MCMVSQDVMDKLATTVKQFLDEGRMFTGYDVTIETRNREKMKLLHRDVRGDIHEIEALKDALDFGHEMPDGRAVKWGKAQINMPGGGWAFVFHPNHLDPKNYQPRNVGAPTAAPAASAPASSGLSISVNDGTTSDSGGEQDDGSYATDYRSRLMIPTRFLKEAGLNPGDVVYVVPDPATQVVLLAKDTDALQKDGLKITTQRVERNGDLRLSSKTLYAAELKDNKFVIETTTTGTNDKVVKVAKQN